MGTQQAMARFLLIGIIDRLVDYVDFAWTVPLHDGWRLQSATVQLFDRVLQTTPDVYVGYRSRRAITAMPLIDRSQHRCVRQYQLNELHERSEEHTSELQSH